jgi:hypothetical protein
VYPKTSARPCQDLISSLRRGGFSLFSGAPGRIRTSDLRIRSPLLSSTELRARGSSPRTTTDRLESLSYETADDCTSLPVLLLLPLHFFAVVAAVWGGRWESNPQPPEPQSGALPLSYAHHTDLRCVARLIPGCVVAGWTFVNESYGAPGPIRTGDPRLRRPLLYPLSYGREQRQKSSISAGSGHL